MGILNAYSTFSTFTYNSKIRDRALVIYIVIISNSKLKVIGFLSVASHKLCLNDVQPIEVT